MSDFLMKPKIDFAFKEITEDEKARVGFLSAVLDFILFENQSDFYSHAGIKIL